MNECGGSLHALHDKIGSAANAGYMVDVKSGVEIRAPAALRLEHREWADGGIIACVCTGGFRAS